MVLVSLIYYLSSTNRICGVCEIMTFLIPHSLSFSIMPIFPSFFNYAFNVSEIPPHIYPALEQRIYYYKPLGISSIKTIRDIIYNLIFNA